MFLMPKVLQNRLGRRAARDGPSGPIPPLAARKIQWAAPCVYGKTNGAIGFRPGQPNEIRSAVPSHVTSVTTTTMAASATV